MTSFLVKKNSEKPMEKEEILAMSRKEKNDEGFTVAEHQGRRLGVAAFSAVLIFIVLFNLFTGQTNNIPLSLCWAFVAAEAYPKYTFTKKSSYLVVVIAGSLASLAFLIAHILSVLL